MRLEPSSGAPRGTGARALNRFGCGSARLKSCPDTSCAGMELSAGREVRQKRDVRAGVIMEPRIDGL